MKAFINPGHAFAGRPDPGVVNLRLGLCALHRTAMPAVLVQAGFIDSEADCRLMQDHGEEMARGIVRGVVG